MLTFKIAKQPLLCSRIGESRCNYKAKRVVTLSKARISDDDRPSVDNASLWFAFAGLSAPFLFSVDPASAIGGEYGIFEGRTLSLLHPGFMLFLFGSSLYAAKLGFDWRRARELGGIIRQMKADLPAPNAEGVRPPSPLDADISSLETERKTLLGKKLNENHENWGHLLLGLGVLFSVAGPFNTYLRTGKLFPGPHLWAGATITIIWALATALTPAMKKGNEAARVAHITLNCINIALFAWQIPTGFEIVEKVFQFTSWP